MSTPPLLVAALRSELPRRWRGRALLVGPAPAWRVPPVLPGDGPLVVTGSCGALLAGEARRRLVLPERLVCEGGDALLPTPALRGLLLAAARRLGIAVAAGALAEARTVVDSGRERAALAARTRCAFVDLESSALAGLAAAAGRPWAVLRFVSDSPEEPIGWLAELFGALPLEEPSAGRSLLALARRPWFLPRLLRLGGRAARGRQLVGRVLDEAFPTAPEAPAA